MGSTYVMRKGVSTLSDLVDGNAIAPQITGNIYYAIQDSEAFYPVFLDTYQMTYPDGTNKVHTTIQSAIDATLANRGDIVYVIGEHTVTSTVLMNKWGTSLIGATAWNSITGGGNANITCAEAATATITVTKAKTHIENLVIYFNGTGATTGIRWASSAPSQQVVRNVEIVKNGGTDAAGIGMHFDAVATTRSEFSNVKITGPENDTSRMAYGIEGGGYSNVFRDVLVSGATVGINWDTYGDLFLRVIIAGNVGTGMNIYGTSDTQSMIVDSRNMAIAVGTLGTTKISASYTTGTTALS